VGLVLFDLDNTLLDREAAFARWSRAFVREYGLPAKACSFMESADRDGLEPKESFFEQVRAEFDIAVDIEELLARYHEDYPACYTVDQETVKGLRQLRSGGWRIGVVTNGGSTQLAKLETTNLVDEFDAICVSELVGVSKPDPAIFQMTATLCDSPLEGWMIGDSATADIAGGQGVGLRTIWIARSRIWTSADAAPYAITATVPQAIKIIAEGPSR
jgi:putative hydrolase of the HAD superfamily